MSFEFMLTLENKTMLYGTAKSVDDLNRQVAKAETIYKSKVVDVKPDVNSEEFKRCVEVSKVLANS